MNGLRKSLLALILILACRQLKAQIIEKDNSYHVKKILNELRKDKIGNPIDLGNDSVHWKVGGQISLTINQGSLQNWAAGGDDFSLSLGSFANTYLNYANKRHSWDNNLNLAFGYLNTTSLGMRKSDDNMEFYSKYGYQFSKNWYYSALLSFRSQFANGYLYPDDSTVVSRFLAPGYVLASLGFDFKPADYFSMLLSPLTSKFTILWDQRLANQGAYGVDSAEYHYNPDGTKTFIRKGSELYYELGAFVTIQINKDIWTNVNWTSRLNLYSNYLKKPQNVDVDWTSLLSLKVNNLISANINTELIYDDNIKFITYEKNPDGSVKIDPNTGEQVILKKSARTQFKELIGVGLSYKF